MRGLYGKQKTKITLESTANFCISVAEEDGEYDEEVASNGEQACHHIGHHVAEHHLEEV